MTDKVVFKTESITSVKQGRLVIIKVSINQESITILRAPGQRDLNYIQ